MILCISSLIVNMAVTPMFIFVAVIVILIYYFIQKYFRSTSLQLESLDNLSQSKVLAHFTEAFCGRSTIRAFRKEENFIKCLNKCINTNNLLTLMTNCSHCWLGISLVTHLINFNEAMKLTNIILYVCFYLGFFCWPNSILHYILWSCGCIIWSHQHLLFRHLNYLCLCRTHLS